MSSRCGTRSPSKRTTSKSEDARPSYPLPEGSGLPSLLKDCVGACEIRFYYITSVKWEKDQNGVSVLHQFGCGLNLNTNYATLCTCKRGMLRSINKQWNQIQNKGLYIGVLGNKYCRKPGAKYAPLIFLGKVDQSFFSFESLWNFLEPNDRKIKSVLRDPLGDLYPPGVKAPPESHVHYPKEEYKKDMKNPNPLLLKEWRAWREGGLDLQPEKIENLDVRKKFISLLRKGVPAPYGRPFPLSEFKSVFRFVK